MRPNDLTYLEGALRDYVQLGVQRAAHSGEMEHKFRLSAAELKEATRRQRLHDTLIDEVNDFFNDAGVTAKFDSERDTFNIFLDLNLVALNRRQAADLTTAMELFRVEHG